MASKKITLNYEGTAFVLEYNRNAVKNLESNGFLLDQVASKPVTMIPELFYGAFYMHHRNVRRDFVDKIYDSLSDKEGLITALLEMYSDTIQTLTSEPTEDNAKNVTWTMS